MVISSKTSKLIYDKIAKDYDLKYVNDKKSQYMIDEALAAKKFKSINFSDGKIVSLGCGTGQDVEICGYPKSFLGYDISCEMLKEARKKFPAYKFYQHDCNEPLNIKADILVSMFGTPNYIGGDMLVYHYETFGCKHAFFIFYKETYDDQIVKGYYRDNKKSLIKMFSNYDAIVEDLAKNSNYYVVYW